MDYQKKYLKYKQKYLTAKQLYGGSNETVEINKKLEDDFKDRNFRLPWVSGAVLEPDEDEMISIEDLKLVYKILSNNNLSKLTPIEFKLLVKCKCINENQYTCDENSCNVNNMIVNFFKSGNNLSDEELKERRERMKKLYEEAMKKLYEEKKEKEKR